MAVYFEARSESPEAQLAVATVVMNRVESERFPATVCEVVQQGGVSRHRCQFSYWCDGKPEIIADEIAWAQAQHIAEVALWDGLRIGTLYEALWYHASYARPRRWMREYRFIDMIGEHLFYGE